MEGIPPIEAIPRPKGFRCKIIAYSIFSLLSFAPVLISGYIWYVYNIWIAVAFFLFIQLASGVISSKMRVASVPFDQSEISYTNLEITRWYVAKNLCMPS